MAIGYTMVYGILRLINFAHGDLLMFAAYVAIYSIALFAFPWYISFPLAIVATGLMGILLDRAAYKPLRDAPRISLLISAIGASFLLENLALVILGGVPKAFPRPPLFDQVIVFMGLHIQVLTIYTPVVTIVLLLGLLYIVFRTKVGKAMRAASKDFETTRLMGINLDRIIAVTFLLGSMLAAAGGIMWAMKYPQVNPFYGNFPRHQGLRCGGPGRHRKHPRGGDRGLSSGAWGDLDRRTGTGVVPIPRRLCFCYSHFGAVVQAYRNYGRTDYELISDFGCRISDVGFWMWGWGKERMVHPCLLKIPGSWRCMDMVL